MYLLIYNVVLSNNIDKTEIYNHDISINIV